MRPMLILLLAAAVAAAGVSAAAPVRAQTVSTPAAAAEMAIPPIVWNLIEFPGVGAIDQPGVYTVQFLEDGQVSAHADCNWVAGLWTAGNGVLDITITQTTLAQCPEGSLEQTYVLALHEATSYSLDGFMLTIGGPSGEMQFSPAMPAVA
jgi:heat shock protein HslJ